MAILRNPLTDEELLAAIDAAEQTAIGITESTIASDRSDAIDRYLGKEYQGNLAAPEGRSSVVSRDVADVVEGVLANVIKPFVSGDQVVKFEPLGPDDEERAQQETDYVNFVALQRNNGFLVLNACLKDALLLRAGYVKCYWTKRSDVILETYQGLSDDELAIILQDKDVEVVQHTDYPDPAPVMLAAVGGMQVAPQAAPMLHDLKLRRARPTEFVCIDPCPPEEVLVSQRTREPSLQESDFVQHRTHKTLSELRQMGYAVDDDITDDDTGLTIEEFSRQRQLTSSDLYEEETQDMSRRMVLFKENWMRIDRDGDGIAELRRVCHVGKVLLADEECDIVPIAAFCPILMQHQHLGVSIYDLVADIALLKTGLLRSFMDNKYQSNNTEKVVDYNRANMDDFLLTRPGGIKRVDGPPGDIVMPLVTPDTGASALQGLEYLDAIRENRTGYTRQTQGLETDALVSKTVGGMVMQLNQSQLRLEMIARTLAETGVREMFRIVHAMTLKYSSRAEKVRLNGKWVEVNPREWVRRTDLSIDVGLGASNQQLTLSALMLVGQAQEKAFPAGLIGPENIYETVRRLVNAAGFKNHEAFINPPKPAMDPKTGQPQKTPDGKPQYQMPQPPPPPQVQVEQMRGQMDVQKTQAQFQHETQLQQMQLPLKQKELELQYGYKAQEQQNALLLQQSNDQRQSELDKQKAMLEAAAADRQRDLEIQLKAMDNATAVEVARINHMLDDGSQLLRQQMLAAHFNPIIEQMQAIQQQLAQPRSAVMPNGKVVTVQPQQGGPAKVTIQ